MTFRLDEVRPAEDYPAPTPLKDVLLIGGEFINGMVAHFGDDINVQGRVRVADGVSNQGRVDILITDIDEDDTGWRDVTITKNVGQHNEHSTTLLKGFRILNGSGKKPKPASGPVQRKPARRKPRQ